MDTPKNRLAIRGYIDELLGQLMDPSADVIERLHAEGRLSPEEVAQLHQRVRDRIATLPAPDPDER